MKKNQILSALFLLFILFSCSAPTSEKIIGEWTCVECGENVGEYTIKFEVGGDFTLYDERINYIGTWELQSESSVKITYSNTDLGLTFYFIEDLSDDELIVDDRRNRIVFKRKEAE